MKKELILSGKTIIQGFDPTRLTYLDGDGKWQPNPTSMRDCISNEILFFLWNLDEKKRVDFIQDVFLPFIRGPHWTATKKLFLRLQKEPESSPILLAQEEMDTTSMSLIVLEILGWFIAYEAFRLNSEWPVPRWDTRAKQEQKRYLKRSREMTHLVGSILENGEETSYLSHIQDHLRKASAEFFETLPAIIAEEQRISKKIRSLFERAKNKEKRDEILPLVSETILPPMGVVTETSPALLRPCCRLIADEEIDIDSGIPYHASVILSILQDPRSTETLLKAIQRFPLHHGKIRENIIYTLGNLKVENAVKPLIHTLDLLKDGLQRHQKKRSLFLRTEQQEEAIAALGKIGLESLLALPSLKKYAEHPSPSLQTYLAWSMGEIGKSQKEKFGGVSADIIISLLKLLQVRNKKVFEESVNSLKKIGMPEFIHSLYLYNVGAVNILGLKPSQKGLYELSETIHFLIRTKGQAIIAVNGDSGTGKTYFCQTLKNGFGDIQKKEILYLMRDRKKDQKIFNRMLGIDWLEKHIDPIYHHDYPLTEETDDPEGFFSRFLEENQDKKLILLDGCRDKYYFQRIIDLFYFSGKLDVEVNFRATSSTRRTNLEEREIALESVRTHLSFLEEPALEDTHIYQEGKAILCDLDNSIPYRLGREEIQELFSQVRIESWGELIRVGDFKKETHPLNPSEGKLLIQDEPYVLKKHSMGESRHETLVHEERKFRMVLNEDISKAPHLIGTIDADDLKPERIRFYAQDQVAGWGKEGAIFIITFLDSRIFSARVEPCLDAALIGRKIVAIDRKGECMVVNFEKNEKIRLPQTNSPALVATALSTDRLVTGHQDGSILVWDFVQGSIQVLEGQGNPVVALASDHAGRIYSSSQQGILRIWDTGYSTVSCVTGSREAIFQIKAYRDRKILVITEKTLPEGEIDEIQSHAEIWDLEDLRYVRYPSPLGGKLAGICINPDGRVLATTRSTNREENRGRLVIMSPDPHSPTFKTLEGHGEETSDCLIMGPKIVTCGKEDASRYTLRIWGSDHYVKNELNKWETLVHIN